MKIVLSPNPYRDIGLKTVQKAARILIEKGADVVVCLPFFNNSNNPEKLEDGIRKGDLNIELKHADMLICFGGDGTILHAAKSAQRFGVPILGINMGSVGFLAELESSEIDKLELVTSGQYTVEKRMMLDVLIKRENHVINHDIVLNDVAITKGSVARIVEQEVFSDNVHIATYTGDGVLISTPTGSTAYSMSAGGPIVEPSAENIVITPVCAHALSARSLVLNPQRTVVVKMSSARKTAFYSADGGKAIKLTPGDEVEIRRSERMTKLVHVAGKSFYETLNRKLNGKF